MGHWLDGFEQESEEIEYFYLITLQTTAPGMTLIAGHQGSVLAPPDVNERDLFYAVLNDVEDERRRDGQESMAGPTCAVLFYYIKPYERKG
jgi:hypothetical protein